MGCNVAAAAAAAEAAVAEGAEVSNPSPNHDLNSMVCMDQAAAAAAAVAEFAGGALTGGCHGAFTRIGGVIAGWIAGWACSAGSAAWNMPAAAAAATASGDSG